MEILADAPGWADSPGDILTIVVGSIAVITSILGGILWLIRSQLNISKSVGSNGSTVHDVLKVIESRIDDVTDNQADISRRISELRLTNDSTHLMLGGKVDRVAERLDAHAASPVHARRRDDD